MEYAPAKLRLMLHQVITIAVSLRSAPLRSASLNLTTLANYLLQLLKTIYTKH